MPWRSFLHPSSPVREFPRVSPRSREARILRGKPPRWMGRKTLPQPARRRRRKVLFTLSVSSVCCALFQHHRARRFVVVSSSRRHRNVIAHAPPRDFQTRAQSDAPTSRTRRRGRRFVREVWGVFGRVGWFRGASKRRVRCVHLAGQSLVCLDVYAVWYNYNSYSKPSACA